MADLGEDIRFLGIRRLGGTLRAALPQTGPLAGIAAGSTIVAGWTPEATRIFSA